MCCLVAGISQTLFYEVLTVATGSVARFDVRRGYGFIIPDDGGEDIFVHQNDIIMEGFRYLKAGEHVSYQMEVGGKGMKAAQVQLLDPRPPEPLREPRPRESAPPRSEGRGPRASADSADTEELRRLRRKFERLVSLLVEKNVLAPGDLDCIDQGFAQTTGSDSDPGEEFCVNDEDAC